MAYLPELINWDAGVYLIEAGDPISGGLSGTVCVSLKSLVNRTAYLKDKIENNFSADMVDGYHAVDFAPALHNHDTDYYTQAQLNTMFSSQTHDDRYYTETEIDNTLNGYVEGVTLSNMFTMSGGNITFKGNLIPETNETLSIGDPTHKVKDMYIAAQTIHLGDNTTLEGTSVTIDAGASPTSISDTPTLIASAIVAKPFTYNAGAGNVTVRPVIQFQDTSGNNYPISFDTVNAKFSFDALGNHGQGTIVAKNLELSGTLDVPTLSTSGNMTVTGDFRADGDVNLGYDNSDTVYIKGILDVQNAITFTEDATLGDGNDDIAVNCGGANDFTVVSNHFSIDAAGNVSTGNITCGNVDGVDVSAFKTSYDNHGHPISEITSLQTTLDAKEVASNKGIANGYASLGGDGKVPTSELPASVVGSVEYIGVWNASTNSPTMPAASANTGHYYKVSVAGSTNIDGETDWKVGDWCISNGSTWSKVDNTESVSSVVGRTGAITLSTSDVSEGSHLYYTDTRVTANATVTANTSARHTHSNASILDNTQQSFTTTLKNKLDAVENGATGDQTATQILALIKTVDGSGSGLDADILGGHTPSYFATAGHNHNTAYLGISANAVSATKLQTARTIDITGDITATAVSFNGTANISISASVNNDSHTHDTRYYTESESNARYLGITAKAADANLLDGHNSATSSLANTIALRDSSGYISAQLFRSEYDSTNSTIGFVMTQINTGTNNYIRPSTPAQIRAGVTDAYYLGKTAKAADANLLDGLNLCSSTRNTQANTVMRTEGSGYANFGWINTTSGATTSFTDIYVNTGDGFIRKSTKAVVKSQLGIYNQTTSTSAPSGGVNGDVWYQV